MLACDVERASSITRMNTFGIVMIVAGVVLSCAVFVHDLRRLRIGAVAPVLALVLHGVLAWGAAPHVLDTIVDHVLPRIEKP